MKLLKLNQRGFDHFIVLALFVVGFGLVGTYLLIQSHAAVITPNASVIFNNPYGTSSQQNAIMDHITTYIDNAPAGSSIYIATYGFNRQAIATSLINAFRRGVHVKVLLGGSPSGTPVTQLTQALGTTKSAGSFVASCQYGCMSNDPSSIMHAKIYLFSQSGAQKNVAMTGSSNLTNSAATHAWNELETVVARPRLYSDYVKYFNDMLQDKPNPNYYWTDTVGNFGVYFYPGSQSQTQDIVNALSKANCQGAGSGYGTASGHTSIRVAMYAWGASDTTIAQKLNDLYSQGCDVSVTFSALSGRLSTTVVSTLLKSHGSQQMPLYNAALSPYYMHQKSLAISGVYDGNNHTKIVFSGSTNYLTSNTTLSNNILTSFRSDQIYNAFAQHYNQVVNAHATPITNLTQLKNALNGVSDASTAVTAQEPAE